MRIDLNADVGEGFEDEALLRIVTSVNIACGGHAGDAESMRRTVEAAHRFHLALGAHPGYPDRADFGRTPLDLSPDEIEHAVRDQVLALARIAALQGKNLGHVKPHGALYNQAARDPALARAIALGIWDIDSGLRLVGLAGSALLEAGREVGLEVLAETFADRRYLADGSLAPRSIQGAVVTDPWFAAAQAVAIACGDRISGLDGTWITVRAETIGIHGDTPDALLIARTVREALEVGGVRILAPESLA